MANSRYVRRLLGLFVLLGVIALIVVVFRFFNRSSQQGKRPESPATQADLALKSIHFTESVSGRKAWELFASHGDYSKAADLSILKDIRFVLLKSARSNQLTVTARRGEYRHNAKVVTLMDEVAAKEDSGLSFETSRISFDTDRRIFRTAEPVRLVDGRLSVEGVGMIVNMEKQTAHIQKQVVATVFPGKSGK